MGSLMKCFSLELRQAVKDLKRKPQPDLLDGLHYASDGALLAEKEADRLLWQRDICKEAVEILGWD